MTRAEWNLRAHRTLLAVGVLAFGIFAVVTLHGQSGLDRSVGELLVFVVGGAYAVYAVVSSLLIRWLEDVRGGAFVCHAVVIAVIGLALFGIRLTGH